MTLTIEELKYGAEVGDLGIDAVRAVCAEALANREAPPEVPAEIKTTIELLLSAEIAKYQNSMSVPDDLVALAAYVAGLTK